MELLRLGPDSLHPLGLVDLQVVGLLHRVGGQPQPPDLLLLLGDDVHGHEDVERVVHLLSRSLSELSEEIDVMGARKSCNISSLPNGPEKVETGSCLPV